MWAGGWAGSQTLMISVTQITLWSFWMWRRAVWYIAVNGMRKHTLPHLRLPDYMATPCQQQIPYKLSQSCVSGWKDDVIKSVTKLISRTQVWYMAICPGRGALSAGSWPLAVSSSSARSMTSPRGPTLTVCQVRWGGCERVPKKKKRRQPPVGPWCKKAKRG
jgi:hypothetical protein